MMVSGCSITTIDVSFYQTSFTSTSNCRRQPRPGDLPQETGGWTTKTSDDTQFENNDETINCSP